ncbi:helix-turn-helix transcriptional regulator [Clostridium botulinum]|nr:helix-turn-helix transcriptional regulator [Clostridium botulinum]
MESGKRVRKLRKELNLTQDEFSKKLNVSRSNIGNIETGIIKLSDRTINDICRVFNANKNWLLTGEGNMFNTLNEDKELLDFVIRTLSEKNEFIKNTFLTLSRLDDKEWEVVEKIINDLSKKNE